MFFLVLVWFIVGFVGYLGGLLVCCWFDLGLVDFLLGVGYLVVSGFGLSFALC